MVSEGATHRATARLANKATSTTSSACWAPPRLEATRPISGAAVKAATEPRDAITDTLAAARTGSSEAAATAIGKQSAAPMPQNATPATASAGFGGRP